MSESEGRKPKTESDKKDVVEYPVRAEKSLSNSSGMLLNKTELPAKSGIPLLPTVPTISLNKHRIPIRDPLMSSSCSQNKPDIIDFVGNLPFSGGTWGDQHRANTSDQNQIQPRCSNRGRTTYSDEQILELEKLFSHNPYPTPQSRQRLARSINVPEGKVKIWFQNRRARAKKQRVPSNGWRCGSLRLARTLTSTSTDKTGKATESAKSLFDRFNQSSVLINSSASISNPSENASTFSSGTSSTTIPRTEAGPPSLSCLSICNAAKSASGTVGTAGSSTTSFCADSYSLSINPSSSSSSFDTGNAIPKASRDISNSSQKYAEDQNLMYPPRFPIIHRKYDAFSLSDKSLPSFNDHLYPEMLGDSSNSSNEPVSAKKTMIPFNQTFNNNNNMQSEFFNQETDNYFSNHNAQFQNNKNAGMNNAHIGSRAFFRYPGSTLSYPQTRSTPLLQSPPPIRRFVFPFKSLLDNTRNASTTVSVPSGDVVSRHMKENSCSFNIYGKTNSCNLNENFDYAPNTGLEKVSTSYDNAEKFDFNAKATSQANLLQQQLDVQDLHGVDHRHQAPQTDHQHLWQADYSIGATFLSSNIPDSGRLQEQSSFSWDSRSDLNWDYSNRLDQSVSSVMLHNSCNQGRETKIDEDWGVNPIPSGSKVPTSTPVVG